MSEPPYLAGLRLAGRRCVVIGGGPVAARRVAGLLASGADVHVISPELTPALAAQVDAGSADGVAASEDAAPESESVPDISAGHTPHDAFGPPSAAPDPASGAPAARPPGRISWTPRGYQIGDLAGAWYVVAATNDPLANAAAAAEAEAARIFCSRADDAALSTAWTPAVGHHAGVQIGVLSPGEPAASDPEAAPGRTGDPRRSVQVRDAVLDGLRTGTIAAPRFRARAAGVALVGGGPGDPDLITVRGRRVLAEADVVVADRLAPQRLLDELAPEVEIIDAAKIPYGRAMPQEEINRILVDRALAGKFVVRLKGGDPYVFGRGYEELLACAEAGIEVTVVPGITSAISVPSLAGVPVTHRGMAHEFTVVSGHLAPDNPKSLVDWAALARLRGTLVMLMAVERMGPIAEALLANGKKPDTPVTVIQDGSLPAERVVRCTLDTVAAEVLAQGVRPPAIVVLGPVAALGSALSSSGLLAD
ncbi:MAG TPA: uroporphyrinogen-III C-methyltransferase [Actinocrinis sp.]|nr:uroporphyrinogen-III C-methyltransferase [Actinocrinis sp.]